MTNDQNDHLSGTAEVVWLDDTGSGRSDPPAEKVLSLPNVAAMFGVSKFALRCYEWRGLIRRRHMQDGVRVYGWADCERLSLIIKCRRAGIALRNIVAVIAATEDDQSPLEFKTGQETCMRLVDRLEDRRKMLDEALGELTHVYALLTSKLLGDNPRRPG